MRTPRALLLCLGCAALALDGRPGPDGDAGARLLRRPVPAADRPAAERPLHRRGGDPRAPPLVGRPAAAAPHGAGRRVLERPLGVAAGAQHAAAPRPAGRRCCTSPERGAFRPLHVTKEVPLRTLACAVAAAALLIGAPVALAHQGNPNYRSVVTSVTPGDDGHRRLGAQLRRPPADAQHQRQGRHDPRLPGASRTRSCWPTARSRSTRTPRPTTSTRTAWARRAVPKDLGAEPKWKERLAQRALRVARPPHRTGWARATRRGLKDKDVRTKIDDWTVPIEVAGQPGAIAGTLTWVPLDEGGAAAAARSSPSPRC